MIRQHVHDVVLAQCQQAQVAELATGEPPVGEFAGRAEVVPAKGGKGRKAEAEIVMGGAAAAA